MKIITRAQAIKLNQPKYFTGKPCKYGHVAVRETWRGGCLVCISAFHKKYYEKNKEKHLARGHIWRLANHDQFISNGRRYHETHKKERAAYNKKRYKDHNDVILAATKKWRRDNPHRVAELASNRCRLLEKATPRWFEKDLVKQVYLKRDELNKRFGLNLEVDHIIPLNPRDKSVCGLHCWANLQLLDKSINGNKYDIYETTW